MQTAGVLVAIREVSLCRKKKAEGTSKINSGYRLLNTYGVRNGYYIAAAFLRGQGQGIGF